MTAKPNSANGGVRRVAILAVLALAAVVALASARLAGRAQPLVEAPTDQIACISYAPFHRPGESPFDPLARVERERIAADLKVLSQRTGCVRIYSVAQGLDAVPGVAEELGMKVLLGAWLARDRDENAIELERAIALARAHPASVRALIVGNEVLLRGELPEEEIAKALQRARAQSGVPVTYADVWEFWLRHPALVESVDFATVHILPYWEDEPVGIDDAVAHVRDVYRMAQRELAIEGRPSPALLLGETGWPSAGRARREAHPGRVEQARFMREFVAMAETENIPYNVIEAFDQPWKRALEGAMGGNWGIFDSDGAAKFAWRGPVAEDPGWWRAALLAALGALAFAAATAASAASRARTSALAWRSARAWLSPAASALAGLAVGVVLYAQWRYLSTWNRWLLEWAATLPFLLATAPLAWLGLRAVLDVVDDPGSANPGAEVDGKAGRALALLRMLFLFGAAANLVLLLFDSRYRGFPIVFFVVPAAVEGLRLLAGRATGISNEARLLATIIAICAVSVAVLERPENREALLYCAVMLAYALARLDGRLLRTRTTPPSSAPIADGS